MSAQQRHPQQQIQLKKLENMRLWFIPLPIQGKWEAATSCVTMTIKKNRIFFSLLVYIYYCCLFGFPLQLLFRAYIVNKA